MSDPGSSERPTVDGPRSGASRPGHPVEVAGRYRILGRIGDGGMGVVYKAEHVLSKKKLAIKLLHPHLSHGKQAVERFRREVSAAAEIDHPGIVQVFDAGMDSDGSFYMAMELLEGQSLASLMKREWPGARRAIEIVLELCEPLGRAHAKGFIHRDLKPDNVFLARDPETGVERVKLLDFGLAREITKKGTTESGVTFGTPEYMAPEQSMSAKHASTQADVWSVGVMLYELLSGFHPFTGETPNAIMVAAIKEPHEPLAPRAPHVPAPICEVVERALVKNVALRIPTAGELAEALHRAVDASPALDDRAPTRTHRTTEQDRPEELEPDMTGIPAADDAAIASSLHARRGAQREIVTEPRQGAPVRPWWTYALASGVASVLVVVALVLWSGTRGVAPEMSATSLATVVPAGASLPRPSPPPPTPPAAPASAVPAGAVPPPSSTASTVEPAAPLATTTAPDEALLVAPAAPATTESPRSRVRGSVLTALSPEDASRARDCLAHNDFTCAVEIYRTSRDPHDLRRVVDALDHLGRHHEALSAMRDFVRRFPSASESAGYRAQLAAAGM